MKICIIGNSHLGALKLAASQHLVDLSRHQITFWGAAGPQYQKISFSNGKIIPPPESAHKFLSVSEGKYSAIDHRDFDLIMFHGAGFDAFKLIFIISKRYAKNKNLPQSTIDAVVGEWLKEKISFKIASQVRNDTTIPIVLSPMACPSEQMRQSADEAKEAFPEIYARFMSSLKEHAKIKGLEVMLQPGNTLSVFANYTKMEFSTNSVRLYDPEEKHVEDVIHMNQFYGAEVLKSLLQLIASRESSA